MAMIYLGSLKGRGMSHNCILRSVLVSYWGNGYHLWTHRPTPSHGSSPQIASGHRWTCSRWHHVPPERVGTSNQYLFMQGLTYTTNYYKPSTAPGACYGRMSYNSNRRLLTRDWWMCYNWSRAPTQTAPNPMGYNSNRCLFKHYHTTGNQQVPTSLVDCQLLH